MKKNWKRILSMFLAFVMVFGMLPVNAFANETESATTEETSVTEPAATEAAVVAAAETTVPVTEAPVVETTVPATEAPEVETTAPATEAPEVETTVPVTEAPEVETTVPVTEAPEVETTEPVTEEPEVETTVPVTEAPEVETTAPVTETPEVETTVPVTEAPVKKPGNGIDKVTDTPTNNVAEAPSEPEETVPEETVPETRKAVRGKRPLMHVFSGENLPENDDLFSGYADHIWFGTNITPYGIRARDRLNEDTRIVYDALVPFLQEIARGERDSTLIKVGTTLDESDEWDGFYIADAEVAFNEDNVDFEALHTALLEDMPYEMYWYNYEGKTGEYVEEDIDGEIIKTEISGGLLLDVWYSGYYDEETGEYYYPEIPEYLYYFYFSVAKPFHSGEVTPIERFDDNGNSVGYEYAYCTADKSQTSLIPEVTAKAQAVMDMVTANNQTDYEKLLAYKNWICKNTSYNKPAAEEYGKFSENINPWQLIYVFDGDPDTKVVCEGYSKAFQYLCELTFSKENQAEETVVCYSVTGDMSSNDSNVTGGAHMWNIVEINGSYYLADITNSDTNTLGADGSLFLVGTDSGSNGTYTFDTMNGTTTTFTYDEETIDYWGLGEGSILNLSSTDYDPPNDMSQAEFEAALNNSGSDYSLTKDVLLTSSMAVNLGTNAWDGYLTIAEGASLTVPNGVILTLNNHMNLHGSLIVEAGGQLVLNNKNVMVTVKGGTLSVADASSIAFNAANCAVVEVIGSNAQISDVIPESNTVAMTSVSTFAELQEAIGLTGYGSYNIQMVNSFAVTEDITIPADTQINMMSSVTLTVTDNATMTIAGSLIAINDAAAIVIDEGAILTTSGSGRVSVAKDYFTNNGIASGNVFVDGGTTIDPSVTMTQEEFQAELDANINPDYALSRSVVITEDMTISLATAANPQYHSIAVRNGVTLTVTNGATLTLATNLMIDGGSVVVEEGSRLVLGTTDYHSAAYIWDGALDVANVSGLDTSHGSITVEAGQNISLPEWLNPATLTAQFYIKEQSDLETALNITDYGMILFYVQCNLTIDQDTALSSNQNLVVQSPYALTVAEDATLIIPGGSTLFNSENAVINNYGRILCYGAFENYGTFNGNEVEIVRMTQEEFETAVSAAAANGETYELNSNVTLTKDLVIASNVNIGEYGALTVADGAKLTIRNTYNDEFAQLLVNGGIMTVQNGATLTVESMMQVAGTLTVENGATVNAHDDCIWLNVTDRGVINGIAYSRLGATYGVETAEEIEAAYNDTDTYAAIHVYINGNITLDRDITIPEGDYLSETLDIAVKVPAPYTLTNNGTIDIQDNNRLEVLMDGTLVNNGTINVSDYAQLVIRGTLSGEGTVNGTIVWGQMTHEELMTAMAQCAATESNWIHESITTLDPNFNEGFLRTSDLGLREGGEIANELHLVEGGTLIVPAGCTLEISNPLVVEEGGKLIIEAGGKLVVNGMLAVLNGTVYIAGEFDQLEDSIIDGRLTFAGETDPWLSETWLDNWEEGWFLNPDNEIHEAHGLHVMDSHWRIYFLNTWDAENLVWNATPVIPTENSEYMTITCIMDMEDQYIRGDQEYAEYFVCVDVSGTMDHQNVNLFVDGTAYPYELLEHTAGFYSAPEVSMDTFITGGHHSMSGQGEEEAVYWLVTEPEYYDVRAFSTNLDTLNEEFAQYVPEGEKLIDLDNNKELTDQGIYKFIIHPDYVEYTKFNWKHFNLQVHMELDDNRDGEGNINIEYWDRDIWIDPAPQAQPQAHLRINDQTYQVFENGMIFRDFFNEESGEWDREQCSLPDGVMYTLEDNNSKIILYNAHLERLELAYKDCWEDDEGYHEEQRLPSENLNLVVYGENTITNDSSFAMMIRNGTNVTVSGTGSLHLYAENSPYNYNEGGDRYAYPTVAMEGGSSLNIGGDVTVTAEVGGSGYHGEWPAQMEAISGQCGETLAVNDNATLTIVTPEGTRTLDESQENYGGAGGIISVSIEVNDNATLNADTIYLRDGVDFTMNGGTVNLDPIGEIFYHPRQEDYYINRLGIYLEHEDSVFTLNDGTINIDAEPDESDAEEFCLRTFKGIDAPIGDVHINGGLIELYGNGNDGGSGIAVQCGWDENGPVEGLPTGNLYLTGGTVNIYADEGLEHEGIYTSALSEAVFSGGTVNASGSTHYIEGHVDWTGDTQLHGHTIVLEGAEILVKSGATLSVYNTVTVKPGGRIIVEDGGLLDVQDGMEIEGIVYIRSGGDVNYGPNHWIDGRITWEGESTAPYLTATWLDNYGEGWYMNDDFFEENGLMSMEEHWRIFFLNTWDAENLVWKSEPVVPTVSSEYMTITRLVDMEDQPIRDDQEYAEYFVHVNVFGTIDRQDVTLYAKGCTIPFEIHGRNTGFFRTTEFTMDSLVQGHDFVLDPTAEENSLYWLVRDPVNYEVIYKKFNYRTWNDEDYSDYITGKDLIYVDDSREGEGIYKITVDTGFVDYVQYDFKNFEIQVEMTLDYRHDEERNEEPNNGGMWIQPSELKKPAAVLDIDHVGYMIFDTGRIFQDVLTGYDDQDHEIWKRQETNLPKGVSYVLKDNKIILDNANLTTLELHPSASGYDEEGNFWEVIALPDEDLTISLVGNSTIENHCGPAVNIEHGMNVTIEGNGQLHAKTTNYPDYRDENGEQQCFNSINVSGGSSLTIGDNATVIAELSGHGYWSDGEAATCHPISGSYEGDTLEVTGNATLTTVLPNGVRRYDESGYTSQIGGYVGIQNFNTVTVSGGTLNTDHLNFYDGGEFNLTGGTANFKDIGGVNLHYETGEPMYHYEGINMRNGTVNISGGELNIDVCARDGESSGRAGFYGINAVNGSIDISGGTVNINGNTDGCAILADTEYDDNGPMEDTASILSITGGTININVPGRIYHGGIVVSDYCEGYLFGGEINDDYGIYRFCGDTIWGDIANERGTELTGIATNVYTHGPGKFEMRDGLINLTGEPVDIDGMADINNALIEFNGPDNHINDGEIILTNGTFRNQAKTYIQGGKITVTNDFAGLPGLQNMIDTDYPADEVTLAVSNGTMDITANGIAIANAATFQQIGGEITATNTSGTRPVLASDGTVMINTGTMNLNGVNGVGLYQGYNFEMAGTENESMLFVGSIPYNENGDLLPAPELNINSKYGIYLNSPGIITGGANVDIHAQGEPINENMDWPIGIFVKNYEDGSGENVSGLIITGGANVNLVSEDTAGVEAMSKGIVSLYSPVIIEGESANDVPKVTIDAEMAVYSLSDSPDETNFNEAIAFFDRNGEQVSLTSRELTETEEAGDYLHTLMDGSDYMGYATVGYTAVTSLDAFLAALNAAAAANEYYMFNGTVVIDRDVELPCGLMIGNGAEIIVKDGATLTNNLEIQVWKEGKLTVEAGGRLDNRGALNTEGTIYISDDGDYAGYVHNTEHFKVGIYANGTEIPSVTGIPKEVSSLQAACATEDQVNYILANCNGYFETLIRLTEDMVLHTMTIPEKVWLNILPDLTITVAEGAFLTVNGGLNTRNSDLVVNGTLISNSEMSFNLSEVTVNGTFENNKPTFINDGSVMTVNGILNNYAPLHVGFWKNTDTEGAAGTLNINGTLNNYDYLNISPDAQITEEDGSIRDCSGVVNVKEDGVLNNTFDESANKSGFIENHGDLNIYGTMMNGQAVAQYGSLHLYGKLDNGGNIRLYDKTTDSSNALELVTYDGAELINNTHIGNFSRNGVITLAEGTYTQGSHSYSDNTTEPGELDARFFDDQYMARIEGAPEGMVSIFYEGSNAEALQAASEAYNASQDSYDRCFLRVVGDMIFPADKNLNLTEGTYLVVLNNGDNYKGSLTVEGQIFNQSYLRLFGADMTIPLGGWITNKGTIEAGMMAAKKPTVTVGGLLENASTAKLDLSVAEVVRVEPGVIQNNLAGENLGTVTGVPIAQQTLFSEIIEDDQAQLQKLISMVEDNGYHAGYFWISEDLHITSSTVIPGNVYLSVQDDATLTIDPGVVLQLDSSINVDAGGNLVIDGTLGVGGTVDVRGTMTVNGEVGTGNDATVTVHDTGVLNVTGYYGVNGGTLDVQGTLNNNGTVSVTWTEERTGSISDNVDPSTVTVWMPFNDRFPNHDEEDIAAMMAFAEEKGYGTTTVQFTIDYTFENSFTVPETMTLAIGAYQDAENYRAATVTIPADKTLTIDGSVQVAKKSALVIEGDIVRNSTGSFYASGSCTDTISWVLENETLTIDGTGDMLDYAENSEPWADYDSLIQSVQVTLSVPAEIQNPKTLKVLCQEEELERTVFQKDGAWYVSFEMDSYAKFAIVEGAEEDKFIQTSYKNGWQVQIGLIEPWFLRLNVTIADQNFVQVDYSTFTDYGYYFVRASELNVAGTPTIEQIVTNENSVHYAKDVIRRQSAGSYTYFYADYDKGLYTYEMSDSIYAVFYFVEGDGPRQYTVVRESNLKQLLDARKDDETFGKLERAVYHKMSNLETDITAYREGKSDTATKMGQLLTEGMLGAPCVDTTYKFGVSTQIVLIEPWGIQVNAAIVPPTGNTVGDHINYAEAEDYGMVMYYDVEGQITDATQLDTVEEMLELNGRAYVFSKTDGSAVVNSGNSNYVTARYNKDIFTYQLDTNIYAMYYVKTGGKYYYSTVRTYNVYELANERGNDENFGNELERNVYCDMVNLYAAVKAYRDDYFNNNT